MNEHDEDSSPITTTTLHSAVPHSPPPSFRSRASSPTSRHLLSEHDPLVDDADRTLAATFDSPSDDDDEGDEDGRHHTDDRQRLMRASSSERTSTHEEQPSAPIPRAGLARRVTELPSFTTPTPGTRVYGGGNMANDGVFANLSAKPTRGGDNDLEEKPPVRRSLSLHFSTTALASSSWQILTINIRHTNKPRQTPHLRIGKPQSIYLASPRPTRFSSTASPLAPCSASSGMA